MQMGAAWGCQLPERGSRWAGGTSVFKLLLGPRATCPWKTVSLESGPRSPLSPTRPASFVSSCFRPARALLGAFSAVKAVPAHVETQTRQRRPRCTGWFTHAQVDRFHRCALESLWTSFRGRSVDSVATFSICCTHVPSFTCHLPVGGYKQRRRANPPTRGSWHRYRLYGFYAL